MHTNVPIAHLKAAASQRVVRGAAEGPEVDVGMKFYTFKLPKFLGGFVKAILNTFQKN